MPKSAIVTLAIGDWHRNTWKQYAEPSWREYAGRFGFDLIALDQPLDTSDRAQRRSPAWQKLLIPNLDWARQYDRLVWLDCDIVVNNANAPNVFDHVPSGKIGAVSTVSEPVVMTAARRAIMHPKFHSEWGMPSDFPMVINTGVLVIEPRNDAALFQHVYDAYEDKGSPRWHYENRPLSWHIIDSGRAHWLDSRFNKTWGNDLHEYYPFLLNNLDLSDPDGRIKDCLRVSAAKAYFFHFAGSMHFEVVPYGETKV
ncbi:MAG: hypothetical protein FJW32_23515 [Acidobacteria bacterium]|nr:hypothetical protein [Acidobacteriota bacterium]